MRSRLRRSRSALHRLALGGAWFFIVVSLLHLGWVVAAKWDDPAGPAKLYHTVADGRAYHAPALTYTGTLGLVTAVGEILLVVAAAAATVLPFSRTLPLRRVGHVVLMAWSLLWAVSLLRLASLDHQADSVAQAALLCVLAGCTGYRAWRGWTPSRGAPAIPARPAAAGPVVHAAPAERLRSGAAGALRAGRRGAAATLERVARFTHRQAGRMAPSDGGSRAR